MKTKLRPHPTPEDQTSERLITAVESAIDTIQERLANQADIQDTKWSVSDLVKLIQLRDQLQETQPRTISVRWVHDSRDPHNITNKESRQ